MSKQTTVRQDRKILHETLTVAGWKINIWANYFARGAGSFTATATHATHKPITVTRFTARASLDACLKEMPKEQHHEEDQANSARPAASQHQNAT